MLSPVCLFNEIIINEKLEDIDERIDVLRTYTTPEHAQGMPIIFFRITEELKHFLYTVVYRSMVLSSYFDFTINFEQRDEDYWIQVLLDSDVFIDDHIADMIYEWEFVRIHSRTDKQINIWLKVADTFTG